MALATALATMAVACGSDRPTSSAAVAPATTDQPTTTGAPAVDAADATAAATSPPTTAPPATAAAPSPEAEVIAAYQAFWDTWLRANDPPNPDHPDLARWYTGPALERARAEIAKNKAEGVALRTPAQSVGRHVITVVAVGSDTAEVADCAVDDGLAVDLSTGHVLNDRVSTWQFSGRLVRIDGTWKVASNDATQRTDGAQPCDG